MSVATPPVASKVLVQAHSQHDTGGYRICVKCIMDSSDPEIQFDQQGRCNHCRRYDERMANEWFTGDAAQQRLDRLVANVRRAGRGREYDCIIGVSGGVDSTMVAYHVKRLGLRPLALHLDNGWNSELAVDNIRNMLEKLQIDLITHVIDWREFRELQRSFLQASVPNCEIPTDHAINALLIKTALRKGIRYVLHGGNLATEGIMPIAWGYYNQDLKHLRGVHAQFANTPLKTLPQISLHRFVWAMTVKRLRYIPILNCLDYNKQKAKELITQQFGWRDYGGKHFESIFTRFFQGYILPRKFGYDKRRAHLSTLVCGGEISREQALGEMRKPAYDPALQAEDREYVIKKLNFSEAEFDKIMADEPRDHGEFPSNRLYFHELRRLKGLFKRIATSV